VAHYLLFYEVIPEYQSQRMPYRAAHLAYAAPFVERGELLLGGALDHPVDGAVLLFQSEPAARAFASGDPYVARGLVTRWKVREWTTVVGTALPGEAKSTL
jgi:uncharacterized protein YciI